MTGLGGQLPEDLLDGEPVCWLEHWEGTPPWACLHEWSGVARTSCQEAEYGRRLAADLGTALQPIPGGKHFTPEDHPEAIAAAVNELLEAADAAARGARSDGQ